MEMQGEQMAAGSAGSLLLGEEGEDEGERTSEKLKAQLYLSLQSKGILSQLKVTASGPADLAFLRHISRYSCRVS